jgi:hypothetical protein
MSAAHSTKEPKLHDPLRIRARVALAAVAGLAACEVMTWLLADRAEGLVPVLVQILGVIASPLLTLMFGSGLVYDAKNYISVGADDAIGVGALAVLAGALAIYSGLTWWAVSIVVLLVATAILVELLRTAEWPD